MSVVVPTAFMIDCQRTSFEALAREHRVEFHPFWLMTTTEITVQRAAERQWKWDAGIREPYNMSVVDAHLGDPYSFQEQIAPNWTRIESGQAPELVADQICRHMDGQGVALPEPVLHDLPRADAGSTPVELIH